MACIVLGHTIAVLVHQADVVLSNGVAMLSYGLQQLKGRRVVSAIVGRYAVLIVPGHGAARGKGCRDGDADQEPNDAHDENLAFAYCTLRARSSKRIQVREK
jgi:hypothetical protein